MFLNNAAVKRLLKRLLWKIHPKLFERTVPYYGQVFSIGIFQGKDLFSLKAVNNAINPVLSAIDIKEVPAAFVADPFVILTNEKRYMFFEAYNKIF